MSTGEQRLSLGYSPCPNDTYVFYGLVHGKIAGAPSFSQVLEDIETLNGMAAQGRLDVVKVSFHALGHLRADYSLLHAGGALGRGCGPMVIAREEIPAGELASHRLAIPGQMTTAALLVRLYCPELQHVQVLPFHRIMEAVRDGEVDAGVIIHESRFTYASYGLNKVVDLGEWWEQTTGHAIPLGGIAARRRLGASRVGEIDRSLRASVEYAHAHASQVRDYVAAHAQEMDPEVMAAHIDLYVNEYTLDYGAEGEAAIHHLMDRAARAGILPLTDTPLFIE
jgi:1,4-dihydroxy-6-naphthoate synthase